MRVLFIVDPLDQLDLAGDSSYALMKECARRGHEVWTCQLGDLGLEHDDAIAIATPTTIRDNGSPSQAFTKHESTPIPLEAFDAVMMRKDPPVNVAYLQATWILERARGKTLLVNDPRGLREFNEHLAVLDYPDLVPPTIVTRSTKRLNDFLIEQGGAIVLKPVDGYGGMGIFLVKSGDPNTSAIFETSTRNGSEWTMAQRYLPEAQEGDKRLIILDGEPLGAVLRVSAPDEARNNFHAGGVAKATEITDEDRRIVKTLAPSLRAYGQYFVGIDIIGNRLTEINITSPTGLRHIDAVQGGNAAAPVIDWLEQKTRKN